MAFPSPAGLQSVFRQKAFRPLPVPIPCLSVPRPRQNLAEAVLIHAAAAVHVLRKLCHLPGKPAHHRLHLTDQPFPGGQPPGLLLFPGKPPGPQLPLPLPQIPLLPHSLPWTAQGRSQAMSAHRFRRPGILWIPGRLICPFRHVRLAFHALSPGPGAQPPPKPLPLVHVHPYPYQQIGLQSHRLCLRPLQAPFSIKIQYGVHATIYAASLKNSLHSRYQLFHGFHGVDGPAEPGGMGHACRVPG